MGLISKDCKTLFEYIFGLTCLKGKITVYLSKRDFIDHCNGNTDPVEGIVHVDREYLRGRKVLSQIDAIYRYGREEDEVMGVKFSKELTIAKGQVVPQENEKIDTTSTQKKLLAKLGGEAFPFIFKFPENAPSSVTIQSGEQISSKPLGVQYRIRTYVADEEEQQHKRSVVTLVIKKLQYAPMKVCDRLPSGVGNKTFTFSHGKVTMEVTLNKEIFYHGENVEAEISIHNNSKKSVKNIKVFIIQHVELTMVNAQIEKEVAVLETREGCPITPRNSFSKKFYLQPLAASNKDKRGIALDGNLKDEDVNLASSTMFPDSKNQTGGLGVVVMYNVKAKISFGTLGGDLQVDVPMKLVHPSLENRDVATKPRSKSGCGPRKMKSVDQAHYEENVCATEDEENIAFEDYSKNRFPEED